MIARTWRFRAAFTTISIAVLALIFAVYWPVHDAGLVWDDKTQLRDARLLHASNWLQFIFQLNFDWSNYFRPLGVLLFAAEARTFAVSPGPMHLVSLGIHLTNAILVGAMARASLPQPISRANGILLPCLATLLFGLHPLLVEPVVWIAGQVDQLVTLFMLLGLLANVTLQHNVVRAAVVGLCFFLAACDKEAAVSFPLLLFVFDWMRPAGGDGLNQPWQSALAGRLRRQWLVYVSVLAAGLGYLALRFWGLGFLVSNYGHETSLSWSRLQLVCYTYLEYWRLIAWPMFGLGPIHMVPTEHFAQLSAVSLASDAAAIALAAFGMVLFWKHKPLGGLIAGVTGALFPVLHILPIDFESSIYHDRYAITAVAIACIFVPLVVSEVLAQYTPSRKKVVLAALIGTVWLFMAMLNVRVTVPLWSDELRLWQWALRENPGSLVAEDHLLSTYLENNDVSHAQIVADALMKDGRSCANCMLNVAYLAVLRGDAERATLALQSAKSALGKLAPTRREWLGYILLSGNVATLRHEFSDAEEAYQAAISLAPSSPDARMSLAYLLAEEGRIDEARRTADAALALSAPDERQSRRRDFEEALTAASQDRASESQK
jgi:hypothetical protein